MAAATASPAQEAPTPEPVASGGGVPTRVVSPVTAAVVVNDSPDLPEQIDVLTESGEARLAAVEWNLADLTFDRHYQSVTVAGEVEGTLATSATVEVVPDGLVYYIDSGAEARESAPYRGVAALVGDDLLNDGPDRVADGAGWGYLKDAGYGGTRVPNPYTPLDKQSQGQYGKNAPATAPLRYQLPIAEPGTYTVTVGAQEWWSGPRTFTATVSGAGLAEPAQVGSPVVVSQQSRTGMISGTVEVPEAGLLTLSLTRSAGTEAPAVAWVAVAKGSHDVATAPVAVAAPTSSLAPGVYSNEAITTLASATPGAVIYYTTDGSAPSAASGIRANEPVVLTGDTVLKAIAVRNGVPSSVATFEFVVAPLPADGYSDVPIGKPWFDTEGRTIQAHGGGFLQHDGWFYWVGENKNHNRAVLHAVSLYRSQDLLNWEFVHDLITSDTAGVCETGTYTGPECKWERPKLLYNEATDTFVLWGHWETADSYGASHLIVATSDTIDGDYDVVRNFRPGVGEIATNAGDPTYPGTDGKWGYGSRDFTVFKDPDSDAAYLFSAQDHQDMRVYRLTDDYADVEVESSYPLFVGGHREAPAVVKVEGRYYVITSGQSGWYPNQTRVASTEDLADPAGWSDLSMIGNNTSFFSQPTNVITLENSVGDRSFIYMGDRWNSKMLGASTYVWLPLTIEADGVALDYQPGWSFDMATASIHIPEADLLSQGKPTSATSEAAADGPRGPAAAANDGIVTNSALSGDATNFWQPTQVPASWTVDLEEVQDLGRIDLSWRQWNGSETRSAYVVEGSVDGESWTTLADRRSNRLVAFTTDELAGSWRYVRVTISSVINDHNGNAATWAAGLVEVQVFGPPATPEEPVEPTAPVVAITSIPGEVTSDTPLTVSGTAEPGNTGWKEGKEVVYAEIQESAGKKVLGKTAPVVAGAWEATFDISGLSAGPYVVKVSASSVAAGNGSAKVDVEITTPRVPGPATGVPGRGVLSSDNWDGDGNFVITMNMWWGQNAWAIELFEGDTLVGAADLTDATPAAQTASFPIAGRSNGTYVFTAKLSNQHGDTTTAPLTVVVSKANPGAPVLSHDNWDGDGTFTVTMNMWWGTNGSSVSLYEDGVLLRTQLLSVNGQNAQSARFALAGRSVGVHSYVAVLANAQGETASAPLTVRVTRP